MAAWYILCRVEDSMLLATSHSVTGHESNIPQLASVLRSMRAEQDCCRLDRDDQKIYQNVRKIHDLATSKPSGEDRQ